MSRQQGLALLSVIFMVGAISGREKAGRVICFVSMFVCMAILTFDIAAGLLE